MKPLLIIIIIFISVLLINSCGDEVQTNDEEQTKYEYFTGKFAYNLVYPHDPNSNKTDTILHERTDNAILFIEENGQIGRIIGKFTNKTTFEGYEDGILGNGFVFVNHIDIDNLQMTLWEHNSEKNDTTKIYLYAYGKRIK
jgi:hypothetical protein